MQSTAENIAAYAAGGPQSLTDRLRELDREWELERLMALGTAALTLLDFVLRRAMGAPVGRATRWLPIIASAVLVQHAVGGASLVGDVLRRRGVRSAKEIAEERYALKALRGDFGELPGFVNGRDLPAAERLLELVQR